MADDLRAGEPVSWTEHGRWFSGRVVRRLTVGVVIKGKRLPASPAAPRWLVETAAGDRAAHPPERVFRRERADPRQGELFVGERPAASEPGLGGG